MSITAKRSAALFRKTDRDLLKLSSGQTVETVHSFRTTTRRLQILLEELISQRDNNQKKLLKMLDRIRKRAGKVRDLDVHLAGLRSLKIPQEPRRKTQFTQSLIELRAKHEKKLHKMLTRQTIREIRKRLKRASREAKIGTVRDPLRVARQMLAQVAHPAGPLAGETLHHLRLAVKRARYAAEFAPGSAEASQFIAELKRLQDAIGNWHDWLTLTQLASKRLGDVKQSSLVAALHNLSGSKFRHAVAVLAASHTVQSELKPSATQQASPKVAGKPTPLASRIDSAA
jgi:CHAD domain-containing protein